MLLCLSVSALAAPGRVDADGDGYSSPLDCDDAAESVYPGAAEACDGVDQDCDGDRDGGDPDHDEIPSDCDRCPNIRDPAQLDGDGDGRGDACDDLPTESGDTGLAEARTCEGCHGLGFAYVGVSAIFLPVVRRRGPRSGG